MSERTEYEPGTPSWTDNASADPAAAAAFYSGLFGWEAADQMPEGSDSQYFMATLRGKNVAALGSNPMPGAPASWNTYVTVASADETAATVKGAGGQVMMEPFDVMEAGRMAVCADPAGAVFMIWEPRASIGAELVNEPGTLSWNELATSDVEGSKAFYGEVFGWGTTSMEFAGGEYTVWQPAGADTDSQDEGGSGIGGMMSNAALPDGTPSFWLSYFNVEDTDATVAKATELGGAVAAPAFDAEGVGRMAVLTDPHGATFAVIHTP